MHPHTISFQECPHTHFLQEEVIFFWLEVLYTLDSWLREEGIFRDGAFLCEEEGILFWA